MEQENYDEMENAATKAFKNLFLLSHSMHLSNRKKTKDELLFMRIMDELGEVYERNLDQEAAE